MKAKIKIKAKAKAKVKAKAKAKIWVKVKVVPLNYSTAAATRTIVLVVRTTAAVGPHSTARLFMLHISCIPTLVFHFFMLFRVRLQQIQGQYWPQMFPSESMTDDSLASADDIFGMVVSLCRRMFYSVFHVYAYVFSFRAYAYFCSFFHVYQVCIFSAPFFMYTHFYLPFFVCANNSAPFFHIFTLFPPTTKRRIILGKHRPRAQNHGANIPVGVDDRREPRQRGRHLRDDGGTSHLRGCWRLLGATVRALLHPVGLLCRRYGQRLSDF